MEEIRDRLFEAVNAEHQFNYENGIELTHVEPGLTRGILRAGSDSINPEGHIHGGAIATLADTVAGCCACSTGGDCVTASSTIEYLRPALGDLFCEATPKKLGRHLSVIQVEITNTEGKLVAAGTFTFFMTQPGRA
ncbi:MAG: PaaI family thioesterase [Lawsonibacter sp.]|nr:PaaI family thioesterase [Lawsonibacter sp.]